MKKLFIMMLALLMVLSLVACGGTPDGNDRSDSKDKAEQDEGGVKAPAKVGDVLDKPEKIANLEDYSELTIINKIEVIDGGVVETKLAKRVDGDVTMYYSDLGGYESMCIIGNDTNVTYVKTVKWEVKSENDPSVYENEDDEFIANFTSFGFGYNEDIYTSFTKCADERVGDFDCYVYDAVPSEYEETEENTFVRIYVDKETGVWVKSVATENGELFYTSTVSELRRDSSIIQIMKSVEMDPQVIYDENNVVITASALKFEDPSCALELVLNVKNNNSTDIELSSHKFEVNGLSLGQNVVTGVVEASSEADISVKINSTAVRVSSIELIAEMAMRLKIEACHKVVDGDGTNYISDGVIVEKTDDLTVKTKSPENFEQKVDKSGTLIFNESGIEFIIQRMEVEDEDARFIAYCVNGFSEAIRVQINFTKINGIECKLSGKAHVAGEAEGFAGFYLYDYELDDVCPAGEIKDAEIVYSVYYGTPTETLIEKSEPMSIQFN